MKKNRRLIQVLILSAVILVGGITIAGNVFTAKEEIPKAGDTAPDFTLKTLNGEIREFKDYRGQYVIANFWGSFCEPCVEEMPLIQKYYDAYKDKGLVVLGINLNEPEATVRGFVRNHDITFPILLDKDQVRRRYGVYSYPTTFFIRPDGKIGEIVIGQMSENTLAYQINKLMSGGD